MGKVFAPLRRTMDKIQDKRGGLLKKAGLGSDLVKGDRAVQSVGVYQSALSSGDDGVDKVRDPIDLFGGASDTEKREAEEQEAARIAALPPPRPLPDEEEISRNRRKNKARTRSTGRASTILSDDGGDYLGG